MLLLFAIVVACIEGLHATSTIRCPDLVPVTNMTLSQVDGYVGDPAVMAECSTGHVFDTGQLTKYIACENSTSGTEWLAAWNDTLGTCHKKMCPNLTAELGINMTTSLLNMFSEYGDMATITCDPGYAFSVDLNEPVTSRVTSSVNVTCDDDPSSMSAVWSDFGTCSEIVCDAPYDVNDANMIYNTTTIGSRVLYECYSGHRLVSGVYNVIATCNSSAEWETSNGPSWVLGVNVYCSAIDAFVGCLDKGSLSVIVNATEDLGTSDCRTFCKSGNYRYASLQAGLCSCGDFLVDDLIERDNDQCDANCHDYVVNSTSVPAFCGGDNTTTVYSSLAGCYKDLDIPVIQGELITTDYQTTCSERCRGSDEAIAVVQGTQCYCFNTTNIDGTEADSNMCNPDRNTTLFEYTYTMVYDLGKTPVTATTCEELYSKGVRMHGSYYLLEPYRREFCYFKDGTNCESGWVGYGGHCYLFGAGAVLNFTEARDFCISNNADLPSITTEEEFAFMKQTRNLFKDVWVDKTVHTTWWTGLFDSNDTKMYSWIDGNVMRFSTFDVGQPSAEKDVNCALEIGPTYFQWQTSNCGNTANVICKKPQAWNECKALGSTPTAQYNYTNEQMTLTFCVEKCRGKNTSYAIVQERTCWCVNDVPSHTDLNKTECMEPCPGDRIQHCGGVMDNYLVMKVSDRVTAKSCEDLQILGIGNDTFVTSPDTTPIWEYCVVPACPYSWVAIGHHCYKSYPLASHDQAFTTCATSDAYIVTIEDLNELTLLISTASNISIYSSQDAWRIGLQALSVDGTEMRWSNGFVYNPEVWNDTWASIDGPEVLLSNMSELIAQDFTEQAFICETGGDYIGCYNTTEILADIAYEYTKMTIQQCVEVCRGKGRVLAFLSMDVCYCEHKLTNQEPGQCTSPCSGQSNQICGGEGLASVYNVSEFVQFATTCDDLFNAGVFISEDYVVNGTLQACIFKDGTNCSYGWLGYQGHCYQHFLVSGSETREEICSNKNATLTSLTHSNELLFLEDYLSKIQFDLDKTYIVYTGVTNGLYGFNVTLSQDGLLIDPDVLSYNNLDVLDLYDHGHLILHRGDGTGEDGGVMCKHNKYTIGCFNKPDPPIDPVIADFPSMELTLCKQTCVAHAAEIALIGLTECYCRNISDLSTMSIGDSDACRHVCKLVPDQKCGNGSVVWAHFTAVDEIPLADNCSDLYQGGVFLRQTYKLENPDRYETCGITDTTPCPAGWLGDNNKCLKIMTSGPLSFTKTRDGCSHEGGYLFNPVGEDIGAFLQNILVTSGLFDFLSHWQTGLYPVFYNMSYVTSRGEIVEDANFDPGSPTHVGAILYNSNDTMLYGRTSKIPYICEMDDDYTECMAIHQTADAHYHVHGNSITMCVYWCKGQGHDYSAVSHSTCNCFHGDVSSFTLHPDACTTVCPGIPSQVCGSTHHSYFTYIRTPNVSVVPKTCSELYLHGVFMSGSYWLDYNGQDVSVQCFTSDLPVSMSLCLDLDITNYPPLIEKLVSPSDRGLDKEGALSLVSLDNVKSVKASSSKSGHHESAATLAYPFNTGWKPHESVTGTWLNIKLSEWYLVAGLRIKGIHTESDQSYIQTYMMKYRNLLTGSMDDYPYNPTQNILPGCTNSYTISSAYPADPVVTTEFTLYPLTWHSGISLQGSIYGQLFSNFNHADPYIGCYMDGNNMFSLADTDLSLDSCIGVCRNLSKQFAGIGENNSCLCGELSEDYGYVDESYCPYNVTLSTRFGTDALNIRPIYRTYGKIVVQTSLSLL